MIASKGDSGASLISLPSSRTTILFGKHTMACPGRLIQPVLTQILSRQVDSMTLTLPVSRISSIASTSAPARTVTTDEPETSDMGIVWVRVPQTSTITDFPAIESRFSLWLARSSGTKKSAMEVSTMRPASMRSDDLRVSLVLNLCMIRITP